MEEMSEMRYTTKQRKLLLETLENHVDETLSVELIAALLEPEAVSRSAIYRNMSSLENEGLIKTVKLPGSQKVGFRYVGSTRCKDHLHLECTRCGRTFHLPTPATSLLIENVEQNSGFQVDTSTVLTGICPDCKDR